MTRPIVSLLTDFGASDHYVGAMKGVILGICPEAQLVDICHDIRPYSILEAAFTLSQAWRCFPAGTVHLVVVDPGVGSSRRALAAEYEGHFFVAPDNGVLSMVGPVAAREIQNKLLFRDQVSSTFHGRDIFAPVAAHLANGLDPVKIGAQLSDPVQLPAIESRQTGPNEWTGLVLKVDRYGNVLTNFLSCDFPQTIASRLKIRIGQAVVYQYYPNYASAAPGELFLIPGSSGYLEVSLNQGDAASRLAISPGSFLTLEYSPLKT